jgi:hypothetical protein
MYLILVLLAATAAALLWVLLRVRNAHQRAVADNEALTSRFQSVVDADAEAKKVLMEAGIEATRLRRDADNEATRVRASADAQASQVLADAFRRESSARAAAIAEEDRMSALQLEAAAIQAELNRLRAELAPLDEEAHLQTFGFYKPHYSFDTSDAYKREEERVHASQASMIKAGRAAVCDTEWQVGGSKAEGRKMTDKTLRLMLRAFNGECDAAVARVKYNNIGVMITRIRKSFEAINKAGSVQQCRITNEYVALKVAELQVTHEYQEKLQEEKEEQRRIREQMREEEIARRELEKAQADAEKEEKRYADALTKARAEVESAAGAKQDKLRAQIAELEQRLADAHERKERAIARAQLTRSGHVYVISNVGSFGEHVYKIGMTRRLDPMDRIKELGDASVPFQFDVHAIIYADDAPGLETTLHRMFSHRRLNRVNERKEFFHVTIGEISDAVRANHGAIELTQAAEAEEFRKTLAILQDEIARQADQRSFAIPAHWSLVRGTAAAA